VETRIVEATPGGNGTDLTADGLADLLAAARRPSRGDPGEVRLTETVRPSLASVRLLRDAVARGIAVTWHGSLDFGGDPALLYHLPPPACGHDPHWKATFRYGLCHYRVGPGFVVVIDRRRGSAVPTVIDDPDEMALLDGLAAPAPAPDGPAFDRLLRRGLVLEHNGAALTVPHRLLYWPIPCTAI
jgi:Family of unknown function (DUF5825)